MSGSEGHIWPSESRAFHSSVATPGLPSSLGRKRITYMPSLMANQREVLAGSNLRVRKYIQVLCGVGS